MEIIFYISLLFLAPYITVFLISLKIDAIILLSFLAIIILFFLINTMDINNKFNYDTNPIVSMSL